MTNEFECLKSIAESLAFFSIMMKVIFATLGVGCIIILFWAAANQGNKQ